MLHNPKEAPGSAPTAHLRVSSPFCLVGSLANYSSKRKFHLLLAVYNSCLNQVYISLWSLMFPGLNILSLKVYLLSEIYFSLAFPTFIVESFYKIYRFNLFSPQVSFLPPQKIQVIKSWATEAKSFLFLIQYLKWCSSSLQTVGISFSQFDPHGFGLVEFERLVNLKAPTTSNSSLSRIR